MPENSVLLHYQGGNSDKVYLIEKVRVAQTTNALYVINFAYGRRTRPLNRNTKTPSPVSEWNADRIFQKLQEEKMGEGYRVVRPEDISVPYLQQAVTRGQMVTKTAAAPETIPIPPPRKARTRKTAGDEPGEQVHFFRERGSL